MTPSELIIPLSYVHPQRIHWIVKYGTNVLSTVAPGLDGEDSSTYPSNSSFAFWEASPLVRGAYHHTDPDPCHPHDEVEVESASLNGPGDEDHHWESGVCEVGSRNLDEEKRHGAGAIRVVVWNVLEDSCEVATWIATWKGTDGAYHHA